MSYFPTLIQIFTVLHKKIAKTPVVVHASALLSAGGAFHSNLALILFLNPSAPQRSHERSFED
mgnify:CR=1 FL=1